MSHCPDGRCILIPRPSYSPVLERLHHFCILQEIKNWTVGRPGNKARVYIEQASSKSHVNKLGECGHCGASVSELHRVCVL